MKLIIAIVNSDDSSSVQGALTEGGYFVTKLSTTENLINLIIYFSKFSHNSSINFSII